MSRKRKGEDLQAARLLECLTQVRSFVDADALVDRLLAVAGHLTCITETQFRDTIVSMKGEDQTLDADTCSTIFSRAQRKKARADKGEVDTGAPLTEVIWLLKHHGVERTSATRAEGRSGLCKESSASRAFEAYYAGQKIMPEAEWDAFMACIRTPLPMTLRMTATRPYKGFVQTELLELLEKTKAAGVDLSTLDWCNQGCAEKRVRGIASPHESYHGEGEVSKAVLQWCKQQNNIGTGQFQEAVSMLPPLMLDPEPHHLVLDMCSAPGSKLLQAADIMNEKAESRGVSVTGGLLSNEIDRKKANQVIPARLKRTHAKSIVVISSDARLFPPLYSVAKEAPVLQAAPEPTTDGTPVRFSSRPTSFKRILFDRIMADVPCSGDGTGRKDKSVWETWATSYAFSLHPKQLAILLRGIDNLKVGGRIVYSTCSLNPLENEAVVYAALQARKGTVKLTPAPEGPVRTFKWNKGLTTWGVPDGTNFVYETPDMPEREMKEAHGWTPTMFPPKADADDKMDLEHCVRVHPHTNDTGGFFVAVFERTAECAQVHADETAVTLSTAKLAVKVEVPKDETEEQKQQRRREIREAKRSVLGRVWGASYYYALTNSEDQAWLEIAPYYELGPEVLEQKSLLVQLDEHDKSKKKKVFITTPGARTLLEAHIPCTQTNNVRLTHVGARFLTSVRGKYLEGKTTCFYRPAFESAAELAGVAKARKILITPKRVMELLENKSLTVPAMQKWDDADKVEGIDISGEKTHWNGPCMFGINAPETSDPEWVAKYGKWGNIWMPAIVVGSKVELAVEDHERVGLLSLMKRIFV